MSIDVTKLPLYFGTEVSLMPTQWPRAVPIQLEFIVVLKVLNIKSLISVKKFVGNIFSSPITS